MKLKRIIGAALATMLAATLMPLSVLKAEGNASVTVETRAGRNETVEVSETVSTDANGVKTTEHAAEDYTTSSGMIVDYTGKNVEQPNGCYEFEDHYTSQDANDTYEAEGGSDKSNEYHAPASEIGIKIDEDDVGKPTTVTGPAATVIEVTGDVKESDDDGIYDYTVKERITQSVIGVTTRSIEITDSHGAVNTDDMEYIHTEIEADGSNDVLADEYSKLVSGVVQTKPIPRITRPAVNSITDQIIEGYPYILTYSFKEGTETAAHESDQYGAYWPAWLYSVPDGEEEPVYDDGTHQFYAQGSFADHLKKKYYYILDTREKVDVSGIVEGGIATRWDMCELFTLADKNGNWITTYCADEDQWANRGYCYKINNLEDASYYGEEEAKHIRAICNNGYWGTESGFGSLDSIKQMMRDSGQFTDEQIEALTPGMAMCAMQMAIWSYSNVMDNLAFVNVHHLKYYRSSISNNGQKDAVIVPNPADPDYEAQVAEEEKNADIVMRLYWLLYDLDPEGVQEDDMTTENTIINEKNFLKSVDLTITDKPANHANNKDADKTNDVYTVDLEIAFKVKPLEENGDDLVLEIQDQNGDTIVKARIAGTVREGEVPATVIGDGVYKIGDLELQEGETALKFALSGTQNLNHDVYFFTSEHRDTGNPNTEWSQPMVGVARGKRGVNIRMDLSFELDVTDEELKQEHYWRTEKDVPHYVELPVEKDWQDADNQDGVRPNKITVRLFADGVEIKSIDITPDENGDWKYTFTGLPKYTADGTKEIKYTVTEDPVPEYDEPEYLETEDGLIKIVNKHTPKTTEISVTKEWQDGENVDGVRPRSITVHLLADGKEVDSATVTPDENGRWEYTFEDLPKYRDGGVEIKYTITEDPVPEYEAEIENYTITNTHEPITTDITITKEWEDEENRDGVRPASITVRLYADGKEIKSATVVPDENGHWEYTFEDLPMYRDQGVEIAYTITEDPVPEYETVIENYKITNTHTTEKTAAEGKKTWVDNDNKENKRPVQIVIRLFADGVEIDSKTVTEADGWKWKWENLPKNKNGKEIKYTVKEDRIVGYTATVTGFDITNTYEVVTGDESDPWLWVTVFGASLLASAGLLMLEWMYRKRRA